MKIRTVLTIAFTLAASSIWSQTATVTMSGFPATITPGQPFPITVDYTTDIHETGHRGVLILEVLDGADQSVILKLDDDNSREGWDGPSGSHVFSVTLNAPIPADVTYRAYLTEFGLNDFVQTHLESYPTDGTYHYQWTGNGVTQSLYYLGGLVISNNSGNATYCSGITFETFLLSYENYLAAQSLPPQIGSLSSTTQMKSFRRLWYGATGVPNEDEYQSTLAIEENGLGFILDDPEDARPGDFIQLWRNNASGHNCIFQSWGRAPDGSINRLNYWSTQGSTDGIGHNDESVALTYGIDPDRLHLARVMKPRSDDDWDRRFPAPPASGSCGFFCR